MLKGVRSKARSVISVNVSDYDKKTGLVTKSETLMFLPGENLVGDRGLTEENWKKALKLTGVQSRIDSKILNPIYSE